MKLLTKTEQKLANELSSGSVVTFDILNEIVKQKGLMKQSILKKTINTLSKKGVLVRIVRGTYAVQKDSEFDPYSIARYLSPGAYVGFESAMSIYGYKTSITSTIKVVTGRKSFASKKINGYKYIMIPMEEMAFGSVFINGIAVSSKAKTLFDCMYKPKYADDFGAVLTMAKNMGKDDYSEFMEYASIVSSTVFLERSGMVLEAAKAPEWITAKILKRIKKPVVSKLKPKMPTNKEHKGKYSAKWHIYDNVGLIEISKW